MVYSSDANFHVAGDGKLGGILEPNDMRCHTRGIKDGELYVEANEYDYPSIGQIIDVINQKEVMVIFAVTEDQQGTYTQLKNLLPNAEIDVMGGKSENVIKLIEEKYKLLRQKVRLTYDDTKVPEGVKVEIKANCNLTGVFEDGYVCEKIGQNEKVNHKSYWGYIS